LGKHNRAPALLAAQSKNGDFKLKKKQQQMWRRTNKRYKSSFEGWRLELARIGLPGGGGQFG